MIRDWLCLVCGERAEPETAVVMTTGAGWSGTPATQTQPEDKQDLEDLGLVCTAKWLPLWLDKLFFKISLESFPIHADT